MSYPNLKENGIYLDLMVNYPLLGDPYCIKGWLTETMIMDSCKAKFSGYPFNQYWISKIFNPHHHELGWREIVGHEEALRILAYHRLNDLLGAVALIDGPSGMLPSCLIKSHMGNHQLDLELVKKVKAAKNSTVEAVTSG